jgi:hypothetical protein
MRKRADLRSGAFTKCLTPSHERTCPFCTQEHDPRIAGGGRGGLYYRLHLMAGDPTACRFRADPRSRRDGQSAEYSTSTPRQREGSRALAPKAPSAAKKYCPVKAERSAPPTGSSNLGIQTTHSTAGGNVSENRSPRHKKRQRMRRMNAAPKALIHHGRPERVICRQMSGSRPLYGTASVGLSSLNNQFLEPGLARRSRVL